MPNKEEIIKEFNKIHDDMNCCRRFTTRNFFSTSLDQAYAAGVKKGAGDERRFVNEFLDGLKKWVNKMEVEAIRNALQSRII